MTAPQKGTESLPVGHQDVVMFQTISDFTVPASRDGVAKAWKRKPRDMYNL